MTAEELRTLGLEAARALVQTILGHDEHGVVPVVVGSCFIKDRTDSDVDVVINWDAGPTLPPAYTFGWIYGGSAGASANNRFESWKVTVTGAQGSAVVNLLWCKDRAYYDDWIKAARVCRFLHAHGRLDYKDVVPIHETIMDGK